MLIDDNDVQEQLGRMVGRLTSNPTLRADLMQEALVRLWQVQAREPAQSRSWYLQNCRFHLQHYLAAGRSIDSHKRRACQVQPPDPNEEINDWMDQFQGVSTVLEDVSVRDTLALLINRLTPRESAVLRWLVEGLGPCEIARQLHLSDTTVLKYRRRIASLAAKFALA